MSAQTSFDPVLTLSETLLGGAAAVLYAIGDDLQETELAWSHFPPGFSEAYHSGLRASDPLSAGRLCGVGRRVALLSHERRGMTRGGSAAYDRVLGDLGYGDALEMILWCGAIPVLGIGVLARGGFGGEKLALAPALQAHFEATLPLDPRMRDLLADRLFAGRFALSRREVEIVRLTADGATNHDLAELLDIRLATVKTHLVRIFDKMGVENRTAMIARYLRSETWIGDVTALVSGGSGEDGPVSWPQHPPTVPPLRSAGFRR